MTRIRFAVTSKVHRLSSLRHRPPDHRPTPQPYWKTCRADDAEGLQGTCEHHGPQAGSSSRLVATAIGRCSSEGQPLVALDCQPSLPRGAEELFCVSSGDRSLHASLGLWMSTPTALPPGKEPKPDLPSPVRALSRKRKGLSLSFRFGLPTFFP